MLHLVSSNKRAHFRQSAGVPRQPGPGAKKTGALPLLRGVLVLVVIYLGLWLASTH